MNKYLKTYLKYTEPPIILYYHDLIEHVKIGHVKYFKIFLHHCHYFYNENLIILINDNKNTIKLIMSIHTGTYYYFNHSTNDLIIHE